MKSFLNLCLTALLSVLLTIGLLAGYNSCSDEGLGSYIKGPQVETEEISLSVENAINPIMDSPADAIVCQSNLIHNYEVDSIFRQLPAKVLTDVTSVLLKRTTNVTKSDIIDEYLTNRAVYDNLPNTEPNDQPSNAAVKDENVPIAEVSLINKGTTTVTEAPPTRVDEVSYSSKDTTIDGKRATIETKITKHE